MASPGQSSLYSAFTELVTTTYRKHGKIADNVSAHNALYRKIAEKGNVRELDGGLSIVAPLDYQENSTYQRFSGADLLNIAQSDVLTAAEFPWCQVAVYVTITGRDMMINNGESRIIPFVKSKVANAKRSLANGLSQDIYSDGTLTNQIGGLQAVIPDAGGGTLGGISGATWAFWNATVQSAAAPLGGGAAITPSAATIESLMLPLYIALTRGSDQPDLIVMSDDYYDMFERSQTPFRRYTADSGKAVAGFSGLKYKGADVHFDTSGGIPAAHAYFINTDFLEVVVHEMAKGEPQPEIRALQSDTVSIPCHWMGNLCCSNRSLNGVMKA